MVGIQLLATSLALVAEAPSWLLVTSLAKANGTDCLLVAGHFRGVSESCPREIKEILLLALEDFRSCSCLDFLDLPFPWRLILPLGLLLVVVLGVRNILPFHSAVSSYYVLWQVLWPSFFFFVCFIFLGLFLAPTFSFLVVLLFRLLPFNENHLWQNNFKKKIKMPLQKKKMSLNYKNT